MPLSLRRRVSAAAPARRGLLSRTARVPRLRAARDSQTAVSPASRRQVSRVVNGPAPSARSSEFPTRRAYRSRTGLPGSASSGPRREAPLVRGVPGGEADGGVPCACAAQARTFLRDDVEHLGPRTRRVTLPSGRTGRRANGTHTAPRRRDRCRSIPMVRWFGPPCGARRGERIGRGSGLRSGRRWRRVRRDRIRLGGRYRRGHGVGSGGGDRAGRRARRGSGGPGARTRSRRDRIRMGGAWRSWWLSHRHLLLTRRFPAAERLTLAPRGMLLSLPILQPAMRSRTLRPRAVRRTGSLCSGTHGPAFPAYVHTLRRPRPLGDRGGERARRAQGHPDAGAYDGPERVTPPA